MPRQIVIQLARFGDILQTGRLLRALELEGETHLCVDQSLVPLARRLHPRCEPRTLTGENWTRICLPNFFPSIEGHAPNSPGWPPTPCTI